MSSLSALGSLVPAYIEILPPGDGKLTFQFNPLEYSVNKSAEWTSTPQPTATEGAPPEFQGSVARKLSVSIFLDSTVGTKDVDADITLLFSMCEPTDESIQQKSPQPPPILFGWGTNVGFRACMRSVDVTYKLFTPMGTTLRAEASLSMEEIPTSLPPTNPSSGGLATRRTHTLVAGENLALVAHRAYGTPTMWRALAEANGIDDPMRVPIGTELLVPDRSEIDGTY
jgi:nucleoid-associated protein YgaU